MKFRKHSVQRLFKVFKTAGNDVKHRKECVKVFYGPFVEKKRIISFSETSLSCVFVFYTKYL